MQHHWFDKNHLQCVIHTKTVFASVLGDLVKIPERGIFLCVKIPEKEIFLCVKIPEKEIFLCVKIP